MTKREKTTVRSIRIEEGLDEALAKSAEVKNVNVNSLVQSMIIKYLEWDSHAEKYGYVSLPRDMVQALIESYRDEKLAAIASELGPRIIKDVLQFWFKKANRDSLFKYVSLISKYGRLADYEIDSEGGEVSFTIRHTLGRKGSIFLSNFYQKALKEVVGIEAQCDMSSSQIVLRWSA